MFGARAGAAGLADRKVDMLINKGMEAHRLQEDILRIKSAGDSFTALIEYLEKARSSGDKKIQTQFLGARKISDLILFAKDRLIELGAVKVQVCKGQPLILKGKTQALVGKPLTLPCSNLKAVDDWMGVKEKAASHCKEGSLKRLEMNASHKGQELTLFCFKELNVTAKNEFPEVFKY